MSTVLWVTNWAPEPSALLLSQRSQSSLLVRRQQRHLLAELWL
jgi:hypothetical protein